MYLFKKANNLFTYVIKINIKYDMFKKKYYLL